MDNQKGDVEIFGLFIIVIIIFACLFMLWDKSEKSDLQLCKAKYGKDYVLGHASTNSSIKWCQAPNGEMKSL